MRDELPFEPIRLKSPPGASLPFPSEIRFPRPARIEQQPQKSR